jgi:hypothetical protein
MSAKIEGEKAKKSIKRITLHSNFSIILSINIPKL